MLRRKNYQDVIIRTLLFAAIWSHEAHSWSGLNYMYIAKYKTLEN